MPIGVYPRKSSEVRFWSRVQKTESCWIWRGAIGSHGYGNFAVSAKREDPQFMLAHRYAYQLLRGPIPEEKQLDHVVCNTPSCVNPWHLEPKTQWENMRRGSSPAAKNARKTNCVRGHFLDGKNMRINSRGDRVCRSCDNLRSSKYRKNR